MQKHEISVVNCEIGSILVYVESGICTKINLSHEFYEETMDNIFTIQLKEYLHGIRKKLDFPVYYRSRQTFERIWNCLKDCVPYGKIITYGELAKICNTTPKVVGYAMSANPLPIYIPCHRALGKNSLGGFSLHFSDANLAIKWKKYLLSLEGSI